MTVRTTSAPPRNVSLTPSPAGAGAAASTASQAPMIIPKVIGPADAVLTATVITLVAFGIVMVYSASAVFAHQRFHSGQYFLLRQVAFAAIGVPVMLVMARIDYHRLRVLTYPFLLLSLVLLSITAVGFGHAAGGAARWISLGPIHIQPAEVVKVAMICWLAYSLSKKSDRIRSFSV
ncbi:MAG TPA: FtsW/RodA/SpoVE family cell cycle protein, partial [Polyangiales bacterium]|nr:FtsW/RodA/SpoVE family cell cycle protein [Polyangiales bacterium]